MAPPLFSPLFLSLLSLLLLLLLFSPQTIHASTPSLTTTITLPPSPIQTLLYLPPPFQPLRNLTARQAHFSRPLKSCRSRTAIFTHSYCLHSPTRPNSLQAYLIYCREPSVVSPPVQSPNPTTQPPAIPTRRISRPTAEPGRCRDDEICVNGKVPGGWGTSMAWCVGKEWFVRMIGKGEAGGGEVGEAQLEGTMMASAVVSDEGGSTPVVVEELEVAAGTAGSSTSSEAVGGQNQTCRDCFELITPGFTPRSGGILADAVVAKMGAAAAAGILWVAVLSG